MIADAVYEAEFMVHVVGLSAKGKGNDKKCDRLHLCCVSLALFYSRSFRILADTRLSVFLGVAGIWLTAFSQVSYTTVMSSWIKTCVGLGVAGFWRFKPQLLVHSGQTVLATLLNIG